MDSSRTRWPVFASIPDLNAGDRFLEKPGARRSGVGSAGRRLRQGFSLPLLAGMALALLVGAVIPFSLGTEAPTAEPTTAPAWTASPDAKKASPPTSLAESPSPSIKRPAALVSALPDRAVAPAILPLSSAPPAKNATNPSGNQSVAQTAPKMPMPAAVLPKAAAADKPQPGLLPDAALMSNWPNPGRAASPSQHQDRGNILTGANQSASGRPPEYQADVRTNYPPHERAASSQGALRHSDP